MGSPLAPAMSDIFVNWLVETATTKSSHQFTVRRYVDDLFLTFDNPNHIDHVFGIFNSKHLKVKLRKENEENNKLPSWMEYIEIRIALKCQYFEKIPT